MRLLDPATLTRRGDEAHERTAIILGGREVIVDGLVVEAAMALDDGDPAPGWLLLLSHDRIYEESLSISLVSPAGEVLDSARIGAAYSPALFSDLSLLGRGEIAFRFLAERPWRLTLLAGSRLRLPFLSDPPHVRRRHPFARRFLLALD